jgi:uncharacterized protein
MLHSIFSFFGIKMKRWSVWISIGLISAISVLIIYGSFIEPYQLQIHHVQIHDPFFGNILRDKTVVQLSDLHINTIGKREKEILNSLDQLKPDIIFLTGDYVKWKGNYEAVLTFLSQLKAKIGIWGVMGDYDYSSSRKSCLFCHEKGSGQITRRNSIKFLKDSFDLLRLPEGILRIQGIDFKKKYSNLSHEKSLPLRLISPSIILSHNPLFFELLDGNQNLFVLAGDTHGGQIPLPFPSYLLRLMGYEKNALYSQGYFRKGNAKMYVSRGIGTSHIPIRLFRKPEIVVLHFSAN